MSRTKGAKNKTRKPPRKSVAVRLTAAEVATLKAIHAKAGVAIHTLIAEEAKRQERAKECAHEFVIDTMTLAPQSKATGRCSKCGAEVSVTTSDGMTWTRRNG